MEDKIYVCDQCGATFDQPTSCANGHAPAETVEYDRATIEAQRAEALAEKGKVVHAPAGNAVVVNDPPPPAAAATDDEGTETVTDEAAESAVEDAAKPTPFDGVPVTPNGTPLADAIGPVIADLEAALATAKTKLGI